ncbi:FtsW/RodA/SpoVE family cell cycle protein, partial [Staphylococcus capitis]|uniref:FtsW/RodA/SpoVE family cell cycle protein n=1 Tax=Staphylococcus capitis TaxID=29388 RepID=UPI001642A557
SSFHPYTYTTPHPYHLTQSLKPIASPQLIPKPYNHAELYIPQNHTHFIFSLIDEQVTFIPSLLLVLIFLFLLFHLITLPSKINTQYNKLFIIPYVSLILFH